MNEYDIDYHVDYTENESYRRCLRGVMKMDTSGVNFDSCDDDIDDETRDELLIDEKSMSIAMDKIYENTKNDKLFKELYSHAAALMFSEDESIGLAVLFSYDYFSYFHYILQDFNWNKEKYENSIKSIIDILRR